MLTTDAEIVRVIREHNFNCSITSAWQHCELNIWCVFSDFSSVIHTLYNELHVVPFDLRIYEDPIYKTLIIYKYTE